MIDPRTLAQLGYGEILRALGGRCRTEVGRLRAEGRPFLETAEEVNEALALIGEARRLGQEQLQLPLASTPDLRPAVEQTIKGGMLEPRELIALAQTLFAFVRIRELLESREEQYPRLAVVSRRMPLLERLAERLDRSFDVNGEISDRASPALKEARDRTRGLHRAIKAKLDGLLHEEEFLPNLREAYYSVRNGRYVLPVLAQHRGEVPGIVHNASQSGQTLFVEPQALIGMGNDLAIAQSMVLEEERRVLQELSDQIGHEAARITEGLGASAELDEAEAAARLAAELDASAPVVEPPDGVVQLRQLRHPRLLLKGVEVIPNDVVLGGARALVISGPNAGGKTITLTAIGLCGLMLRSGLPIPAAEGSRLPLWHSIHSTIGDAQDLSRGLSTFSAHVLELANIVKSVHRGSLALIDEIAADTDPREGAAIAIAVLEEVITRGAVVLVTTHLEELKALAHMDERFVNARVGFDAAKMAPTYRLQLGVAGASSAIEIAQRMGLPDALCARARELVLHAGGPLAKALAAAEEQRRQLGDELERAQAAARAAHEERDALAAERAALLQERKELELRHAADLKAALEQAQAELKALVSSLREQRSLDATEQARRELRAREEEAEAKLQAAKAEKLKAESPSAPLDLKTGAWVHHARLGRDVEILEVIGDEVLVAAGALKIRVPAAELAPARKGRPQAKFPDANRGQASLKRAEQAAAGAPVAAQFRCDIRGMRADEAIREVEKFLDQAARGGEEAALILHGHGTGALKAAIREYLEDSPYVRMYRPGASHEGGDGVTVVALRA